MADEGMSCKSGRCAIDHDGVECLRLRTQLRASHRFAFVNLVGWLVVLAISVWRIARS